MNFAVISSTEKSKRSVIWMGEITILVLYRQTLIKAGFLNFVGGFSDLCLQPA